MNKELDFSGKNIVITGGCGILGQKFSHGFAARGANLFILDKDLKSRESFAQEISEKYKVKAKGFACDISQKESVQLAKEAFLAEFSQLDILLNNAASKSSSLENFFQPFESYSLETWQEVMSVNIDGMFLVSQAFGSMMAKAGNGNIIQVSSIYGMLAPDQRIYEGSEYMGVSINTPAVYSASKAAVIGLTNYLASYWGSQGVRVNTLTPGGVESGQNETFKKHYSARVPLGQMAEADDMVNAALYLASDMAKYVNGHNLVVDGGLSVW